MCEQEYVGCPHCSEPADGDVRRSELSTERIDYHLDSSGDITHDLEPEYSEDAIDCQDDGFKCLACGWMGSDLDYHCTSEDCECYECSDPEPDDPGPDPDRIVVLRRTVDQPFDLKIFGNDVPAEFSQLWADRAVLFLPLPRWRAAELYREYLCDAVGAERTGLPIHIDFRFEIPDEAAYNLILPGFDPHKPDYKGAPDGGHVAACA